MPSKDFSDVQIRVTRATNTARLPQIETINAGNVYDAGNEAAKVESGTEVTQQNGQKTSSSSSNKPGTLRLKKTSRIENVALPSTKEFLPSIREDSSDDKISYKGGKLKATTPMTNTSKKVSTRISNQRNGNANLARNDHLDRAGNHNRSTKPIVADLTGVEDGETTKQDPVLMTDSGFDSGLDGVEDNEAEQAFPEYLLPWNESGPHVRYDPASHFGFAVSTPTTVTNEWTQFNVGASEDTESSILALQDNYFPQGYILPEVLRSIQAVLNPVPVIETLNTAAEPSSPTPTIDGYSPQDGALGLIPTAKVAAKTRAGTRSHGPTSPSTRPIKTSGQLAREREPYPEYAATGELDMATVLRPKMPDVPFSFNPEAEARFLGYVADQEYRKAVNMLPDEQKFALLDTPAKVEEYRAIHPAKSTVERLWVCRALVKVRYDGNGVGIAVESAKEPCLQGQCSRDGINRHWKRSHLMIALSGKANDTAPSRGSTKGKGKGKAGRKSGGDFKIATKPKVAIAPTRTAPKRVAATK